MIDLSSLNENQSEAVNWDDGPLLVLAGPGSGKTRVLTYRIARLIEATPDKHFKILGLTFTHLAAVEMRERIAELVPGAGERTLLTTFHSFAADLLRQHGHHIGLTPDFTIVSQDADRCTLLNEAIDRINVNDQRLSSERLLPLISRMIENDVTPQRAKDYLRQRSIVESTVLAEVYRNYRALMIERNSLDFVGLIAETIGLLQKRDGVRRQVHRVYPYICVDEFQDTNLSQYRILSLVVSSQTKNLFVVADDDQIIYQWNGASPERLRSLRDDFQMALLQLPENYRCPMTVVELANKLIANNFDRFAEKGVLKARKSTTDQNVVRIQHFTDFDQEANWVVQDIAERLPTERTKCVVLARTRKLLDVMIDAFDRQDVPAYLATRKNEFESSRLQWIHSVLRLANARSSREYLRLVCKSFFSLEGIDLNVRDIMSRASAGDGDFLRSWYAETLNSAELSESSRTFLDKSIPNLIERLDVWCFQDGAFEWLDSLPGSSTDAERIFDPYQEEKDTWNQLVREITTQYGEQHVTLHLLLQELDLRSKSPPPAKNAIPCYTIHAAKGKEFDHVYLIGMVEDQLPSWAAIKKGPVSREMQEERRNCFVAITRAQQTLTLTYAASIQGWSKHPSRFLREMNVG